jgi:hypothetical protein
MNLDSLITVVSLLVAAYAIVPRVRKLEFRLKFGLLGWVAVLASSSLILYLQYYQTFRILGLTPSLNLARWKLTTDNMSFLVLTCAGSFLGVYLSLQRLSRRRIYKFRDFASELSYEKRYAELFSLVKRNLTSLARVYHADFALPKVRKFLDRASKSYSVTPSLPQLRLRFGNLDSAKRSLYSLIKVAFPTYQREKEAAGEVVHEVLLNPKAVKGMIEAQPYCALHFYGAKFYEFQEFFECYLDALIQDKSSVLYHEIRHNQNLAHGRAYQLPNRNRLLSFLFQDCSIAERLAPYKPIGDAVIAELDARFQSQLPDSYNGPMRTFYQEGKWESRVFVGIRFFDIMVVSALHQGIRWHMWLHYFSTFAEQIVRNLDPDSKNVDPLSEWPTQYHFLLYEIVSRLCDWISEVECIPLDQPNVMLESAAATHENGNIPKSAMLTLGRVFKEVHTSDAIDDGFRGYLTEVVFRCYFDLHARQDFRLYSEALLNALRNGGFIMSRASGEYSASLLDSFNQIDLIPFDSDACDEVRTKLRQDVKSAGA